MNSASLTPALRALNHHRRAVRVVGTHIQTTVSDQILKPHPNIRLDILDQMADVDIAIRVGQGRSDK